jgi:hypothetical protein
MHNPRISHQETVPDPEVSQSYPGKGVLFNKMGISELKSIQILIGLGISMIKS